ncbi:MAG: RNA methyltransferase [Bacteroidales bacterium]
MLSKTTISLIRSLEHKKYRIQHQLFVAEGEKLVGELRIRMQEKFIYTTQNNGDGEFISARDMAKISFLKNPSSILGVFALPNRKDFTLTISPTPKLTLVLDGVQDPGNLGTIIRTCSWFGIKQLVCSPYTVDCYSPKVLQATMGAIAQVQVHYTELLPFLQQHSDKGINIFGTFLEGQPVYESKLQEGGIVIMGNEGQGISADIAAHINLPIYIPPFNQKQKIESLNVAIATSIICYEFCKR